MQADNQKLVEAINKLKKKLNDDQFLVANTE